jgi:hypothetical protein
MRLVVSLLGTRAFCVLVAASLHLIANIFEILLGGGVVVCRICHGTWRIRSIPSAVSLYCNVQTCPAYQPTDTIGLTAPNIQRNAIAAFSGNCFNNVIIQMRG